MTVRNILRHPGYHCLYTKLRAGRSGVQFPGGKRDFYFLQNYRTGEGPLTLLFSEYFTHFHLVPRLKNEWSYTSTPLRAFMEG